MVNEKLIEHASIFFDMAREEVKEKLKTASRELADEWHTKEDMESFYTKTDNYVFDLIQFNSQDRIDNLLHPIKGISGARILDFGGGIGEISRQLAEKNKVFYYDLESVTKEFAKYVCKKENIDVEFLDKDNVWSKKYDVVILADVLEHVPYPMDVVYKVHDSLAEDGLVLTTGLIFSTSDRHPQHLKENLQYRKEHDMFYNKHYIIGFYHMTPREYIYLWIKKKVKE